MNDINEYDITKIDLTDLKEFITTHGTPKIFKKNDYLLYQDTPCHFIGLIEKGICRFTHINSSGDERIVGFSLTGHLVSDYTACLCQRPALVNIQAITECHVLVIPYSALEHFWATSSSHQQLGRKVAEQLFVMTYRRLIESYCCSPEERYLELMNHYPDLKEQIPLKEIASYIGVTPETVSKIRKKLLNRSKS